MPVLGTSESVGVGAGERLVGRTLPSGWNPEQYGDQQIGPEQFIWKGNDTLIYSKNVAEDGTFSYSKGEAGLVRIHFLYIEYVCLQMCTRGYTRYSRRTLRLMKPLPWWNGTLAVRAGPSSPAMDVPWRSSAGYATKKLWCSGKPSLLCSCALD